MLEFTYSKQTSLAECHNDAVIRAANKEPRAGGSANQTRRRHACEDCYQRNARILYRIECSCIPILFRLRHDCISIASLICKHTIAAAHCSCVGVNPCQSAKLRGLNVHSRLRTLILRDHNNKSSTQMWRFMIMCSHSLLR